MQKIFQLLNQDALRPFRFLIVGGIATLTHLIVAAGVLALFPEMIAYMANVIAFIVAFIVSFQGHRHITFQTAGSAWRFFIVALVGFVANNMILTLALWLSIPAFWAIAIATVCVPVLTYTASSLWAFKKE